MYKSQLKRAQLLRNWQTLKGSCPARPARRRGRQPHAKMLNRRKYTQSQKTGHKNGIFEHFYGFFPQNFRWNRFYGKKMIF